MYELRLDPNAAERGNAKAKYYIRAAFPSCFITDNMTYAQALSVAKSMRQLGIVVINLSAKKKVVPYQSKDYLPENVTGKYARVEGRKPNYRFKIFETTGPNGKGRTLREYLTNGEELPQDLKERCIKSKTTEKWI